jgi:beta-lactamase superfamily II metal-dependent hydrolase
MGHKNSRRIFLRARAVVAGHRHLLRRARRRLERLAVRAQTKNLERAALIFIVAGYFWHWQATRGETELTVLPLNGGHAVWVDAAGTEKRLARELRRRKRRGFTLKPFLRAQGVNRISRLC